MDNNVPPPGGSAWHMLTSYEFWTIVWLWLAATIGRVLVSDEPLQPRKILGELTLACVGAVVLYALGVLRGYPPMQIILIGGGLSLGGVRVLTIVVQIARAVIAKHPV